jgi:hypothetical protein
MKSIWSPPLLAVAHPSLFSALEIDRFEREILSNPKSTERDASEFFARFPKFLFLGQGNDIRREVVLIDPNRETNYRVDFFRKSYGTAFWDIIELKHPQKPFVIASKGHPRLSSDVTTAISQAEDYRERIIEDSALRAELLSKGITVYKPQILVIVGKNNTEVSPETMQILYDRARKGPIEVRSYDDIYQFAKEHYEANHVIIFLGQIGDSRNVISEDLLDAGYPDYHNLVNYNIDAIDQILTSIVSDLEKNADRREKLRTAIDSAIKSEPTRFTWNVDLIRMADKNGWPIWAVECLPSLFIPQHTQPDGTESLIIWSHIFDCLPNKSNSEIIAKYCRGRVLWVRIDMVTSQFLKSIAPMLEEARISNPYPTDRAMIAVVADAVTHLEFQDSRNAKVYSDARKRLLSSAGVLSSDIGINVGEGIK